MTKTSGPTKRIQEPPFCVSELAYICNPFWLKTGFDLIKKLADFPRDYLMPKLTEDYGNVRKCMASYNDMVTCHATEKGACKGRCRHSSDPSPWLAFGRNILKELRSQLHWLCWEPHRKRETRWEGGSAKARTLMCECTMVL